MLWDRNDRLTVAYQAIALKPPASGSMRAIAMFHQLTLGQSTPAQRCRSHAQSMPPSQSGLTVRLTNIGFRHPLTPNGNAGHHKA